MIKEIKKIRKISLANVTSMFYGVIGFFVACCTFIFSISSVLVYGEEKGPFFGFILFNICIAILVGLVVSVITAVFGWLLGFLIAIFYNMFATRLGGIKVELEDVVKKEEKEKKKEGEEKKEKKVEPKENKELQSLT